MMVKTVFIAMWFNDITQKYSEEVVKTIKQCGYDPIIIKDHDYEGYIMDQIIYQIKISKLVIVDYTVIPENGCNELNKINGGSRGGVYYEAGFAKGLNKAVINTCRNDIETKRRLHFDIDQINRIEWGNEDLDNGLFNIKLKARILSIVGEGPLMNK